MISYQCIISGRVQGVYYRASVHEMASEAGFNGYVMNLPGGNVEACVSVDDKNKLNEFISILKAGSPYSHVDKIETRTISNQFENGFFIYR
ncbi:MAG: acylphosphatase [Gammaproteobacteria bacterium]|nr:acylphosphatase [Gammaproteobacteria bacterium]